MRKLAVFNSISLDGYFTGVDGDLSWAHQRDPEWDAFVSGNASGDADALFGRVTYDMMVKWWPTPAAAAMMPTVAEGMNRMSKTVFSRTLDHASWSNTRIVRDDIVGEVRRMKEAAGPDMIILGSGTIVAQLAAAGLVDEFQVALTPVILGRGRTMFEGVPNQLRLKRTRFRTFENGSVVLWYEPVR